MYKKAVRSIPIACVDIIIKNKENKLLLVKRKNSPAKGRWWLPGGRVKHGEKREVAAKRKAKEECGLKIWRLKNLGTFEIFFRKQRAHSITTVYSAKAIGEDSVKLDKQGARYCWVQNTKGEFKKSAGFMQMVAKIERSQNG
jgi:ADP-ribose pyrophosphatase YjhB (NUDIX family)